MNGDFSILLGGVGVVLGACFVAFAVIPWVM